MKPWKIQKFFGDVIYDLRSRGLLPVAVLLLVGMVAVPVIVSRGSSSSAPATPAVATQAAAELAPENQAAVLAYSPGVRNYKERLRELSTKDPFGEQFGGADVAATALDQSIPTVGGTTAGSTGGDVSTGTGGGTSGGGSSGGSSGGGKSGIRYFHYVTDVEIEVDGEETKKKAVDPFDYLPGKSAPVLVFLGNQSDKSAVFLVSKDVLSHEGAGDCFPDPEACQLLALKVGESEELVYGIDSKTYRIKVTSVKLKVSRKLPG